MIEELWPGGPYFEKEDDLFKPGTDSVLLAYFAKSANIRKIKRAVDLGCGSGIISILLAYDNSNLLIDGIEIQPRAVQLAARNVFLSGMSNRINVIEGDIRRHREFLGHGGYDLTISNPPYYAPGSGKRPIADDIAAARGGALCTLDDLCKAACFLTRWGGSFLIVQKPERLADVFRAVCAHGFEPKRLRMVQHTRSSAPNLVLLESRRGGKPSLKIEMPLILKNDDGSDSDEARLIYRMDTGIDNYL